MSYIDEPITQICSGRGCEKKTEVKGSVMHHEWFRRDALGIPTGLYCDDCYENNYPYRRDDYSDDCCEDIEPEEELDSCDLGEIYGGTE